MASQRILCSGGCGASITVEAEDASSVTYTCARCAPQDEKADATNLSRDARKAIPKETLKKIKEDLATAPSMASETPTTVVTVESDGATKHYEVESEDHDEPEESELCPQK